MSNLKRFLNKEANAKAGWLTRNGAEYQAYVPSEAQPQGRLPSELFGEVVGTAGCSKEVSQADNHPMLNSAVMILALLKAAHLPPGWRCSLLQETQQG